MSRTAIGTMREPTRANSRFNGSWTFKDRPGKERRRPEREDAHASRVRHRSSGPAANGRPFAVVICTVTQGPRYPLIKTLPTAAFATVLAVSAHAQNYPKPV